MESDYGTPKPKDMISSQEPEAQLVEVGNGFRVDTKELIKRIDGELVKIANEELMPYKFYLRHSAKIFVLPFIGFLVGIGGFFTSTVILQDDFVSFFIFLSSCATTISSMIRIIGTSEESGFLFDPIFKIYRARKIFRQVIEELRTEVLAGKTDIKTLKYAFPERVQSITSARKEAIRKMKQERDDAIQKIYQKRDEIIKKAKESDI